MATIPFSKIQNYISYNTITGEFKFHYPSTSSAYYFTSTVNQLPDSANDIVNMFSGQLSWDPSNLEFIPHPPDATYVDTEVMLSDAESTYRPTINFESLKNANIMSFRPMVNNQTRDYGTRPYFSILTSAPRHVARSIYLKWLMGRGKWLHGQDDYGIVRLAGKYMDGEADTNIYHNLMVRMLLSVSDSFCDSNDESFYTDDKIGNGFKLLSTLLFFSELERSYVSRRLSENKCWSAPVSSGHNIPSNIRSSGAYSVISEWAQHTSVGPFNPGEIFGQGYGLINLLGYTYVGPICYPMLPDATWDGVKKLANINGPHGSNEFRTFWQFAKQNNLFIPPYHMFDNITIKEYFECPLVWVPILISYFRFMIKSVVPKVSNDARNNVLTWYLPVLLPASLSNSEVDSSGNIKYDEVKAYIDRQYGSGLSPFRNIERGMSYFKPDSSNKKVTPKYVSDMIRCAFDIGGSIDMNINSNNYTEWWSKYFTNPFE